MVGGNPIHPFLKRYFAKWAYFLAPKMCLIPSAKWVKPTAKWVKLFILFCLEVGFKINFGRKIYLKVLKNAFKLI